MRKYLVAGNWKMNGSRTSVQELLEGIVGASFKSAHVDLAVFPPFPFLEQAEQILKGTNIAWGAQNLSDKPSGAYTGEISASMLLDFGCKYVLVGHSERRSLYGEIDEIVATKFAAACDTGLTPILCVGETLEEREQEITNQVVSRQIDAILNLDNGVQRLKNAVIAYEPVWAIGTGLTATSEQAQEVHVQIRAQIAKHSADIAENLQILYGGSVKPDNAKSLFAMADIDGGLIGGASLKANDFIQIGQSCSN